MPRRRPVLKNMAILTGGGLIERFLGALYRVILARAAGPEALGLIQFVLPALRLGSIVGTLGLPQVLTRTVAGLLAQGRRSEAGAVVRWSLRAVALTSGAIALILLFGAPWSGMVFPDRRVVPLLRCLAPIVVCDCLAWILQADLQGRNRMWPVTLSGLVGQSCKLAITLLAIRRAVLGGPGAAAVAVLAAMAASEAAALAILAGAGMKEGAASGREKPRRRMLLLNSLPLMGDGLVFAMAGAVDVMVIPRRLVHAGYAADMVTGMMGQAWGMALPTLFLPMVVIWPIAAATLPMLAEALAKGDLAGLRRRIGAAYGAVAAIAISAAALFLLLPGPIVALLYACPAAAAYLRSFAWAVCPIYLASIGGTLLTGLGLTGLLFRQSLVCATIRTFLLFILTGVPRLGMNGAILAIATGNALLALANGWGVWRCLEGRRERQKGKRAARPAPSLSRERA